jgi:ATP-dependent protease ClpP protease subunit
MTTATDAYIMFTPASVAEAPVKQLLQEVQNLVEAGTPSVTLLISSPGGAVYYGILAYNFLKGSPIEVITHNINTCDSISAVIYAAGSKRLSVTHGRFLLHGIQVGFPQGANLSETLLAERLSSTRNDTNSIAGILATASGKSTGKIHEDMLTSLTMSPAESVDYGLTHELVDDLYPSGAKLITVQ